VAENNEDSKKDKTKVDEKVNSLVKQIMAALDSGSSTTDVFEELAESHSFDEEIEQILANFNEQTMDLTKLQTQIIILIKKYLGTKKFNKSALGKDVDIDEKLIAANIAEASDYLIQQRLAIIKETNKSLENNKDNYQGITSKSRADFKKIIKNFAVYEIYKVMNPKRIAGETRKENFAHNVIERGLESAKHYAGGTKHEIERYSPQFVKKLENAHTSFKRGGSKIER
jgi:hypothetical protein